MQNDSPDSNNRFGNMVDATNDLTKRGYTAQFQIQDDGLSVPSTPDKLYKPENISVKEYHRFEGPSSPDDMGVIYAVETNDGVKGTLIDAYGTYSSGRLAEFMKKVNMDTKG
jgi:hypothetical protein